jgi:protein tyrosine phosphatase
MRDIGSRRITGPEAILVAAVIWWFDQHSDLEFHIHKSLEKADLSNFTSRVDFDLGNALATCFPVDKTIQNFWDLCKHNSTLKHMIEQATRARKEGTIRDKVDMTRHFVNKQIISELGAMVKRSNFIKKNLNQIKKLRRDKGK